jgi:hypothetical protein
MPNKGGEHTLEFLLGFNGHVEVVEVTEGDSP